MQYDYESERPRSSSSGAVAVIVALLLLIVVFGGGAYLFARVRAAEQAMFAERAAAQQVRAQAELAAKSEAMMREMAERANGGAEEQGPLEAARQEEAGLPAVDMIGVKPIDAARQEATITINVDGSVALHGVAIPIEQIGDKLKELDAADASAALTVSIRADETCEFRHVAAVMRQCEEAGFGDVRIAVHDDAGC